jgi:hypothetical protein
MQYFFRNNQGITEAMVKNKFKTMMSTNKTDMLSIMKQSVKDELLIEGTVSQQTQRLETLINNTNSDLYKFIKIK